MSLLAGLSQQGEALTAHNSDAAAHEAAFKENCRTTIVCSGSSTTTGTGGASNGYTFARVQTGTAAGSTAIWGARDLVWSLGKDPAVIDWSRDLLVELKFAFNRFDADTVFRITIGKGYPLAAGAPVRQTIGIKIVGKRLWTIAHNGSVLAETDTGVDITSSGSHDLKLCMKSGVYTATVNGVDYVQSGAPSSGSLTISHLSHEVLSTTGTTNTFLDIITPRFREPQY